MTITTIMATKSGSKVHHYMRKFTRSTQDQVLITKIPIVTLFHTQQYQIFINTRARVRPSAHNHTIMSWAVRTTAFWAQMISSPMPDKTRTIGCTRADGAVTKFHHHRSVTSSIKCCRNANSKCLPPNAFILRHRIKWSLFLSLAGVLAMDRPEIQAMILLNWIAPKVKPSQCHKHFWSKFVKLWMRPNPEVIDRSFPFIKYFIILRFVSCHELVFTMLKFFVYFCIFS